MNTKVHPISKYCVKMFFWDIEFEFGFVNLPCQRIAYMEL